MGRDLDQSSTAACENEQTYSLSPCPKLLLCGEGDRGVALSCNLAEELGQVWLDLMSDRVQYVERQPCSGVKGVVQCRLDASKDPNRGCRLTGMRTLDPDRVDIHGRSCGLDTDLPEPGIAVCEHRSLF